jgi:hypothetical protein
VKKFWIIVTFVYDVNYAYTLVYSQSGTRGKSRLYLILNDDVNLRFFQYNHFVNWNIWRKRTAFNLQLSGAVVLRTLLLVMMNEYLR